MVGLVLISHSEGLASGLAELAGQMATDVVIRPAGGTDDGRIGTSLEKVLAALVEADSGDGVVVLYDLGSAHMTAEIALEMLDDEARARTVVVDAPFVEAAIAAATTASGGTPIKEVVEAARAAANAGGATALIAAITGLEADVPAADARPAGAGAAAPPVAPGASAPAAPADAAPATSPTLPASQRSPEGAVERTVTLVNKLGLHARTAADVARLAQTLPAEVLIARTDRDVPPVSARSVLGLAGLNAPGGTRLRVMAAGDEAERAAAAMADLLASGFGED